MSGNIGRLTSIKYLAINQLSGKYVNRIFGHQLSGKVKASINIFRFKKGKLLEDIFLCFSCC